MNTAGCLEVKVSRDIAVEPSLGLQSVLKTCFGAQGSVSKLTSVGVATSLSLIPRPLSRLPRYQDRFP